MHSFIAALVLAAVAADDPLGALEKRQQALFERTAPSVVFISMAQGFGSGFFVDKAGLVLTNAHFSDRLLGQRAPPTRHRRAVVAVRGQSYDLLMAPDELARRLEEADRARLALRKATLEWRAAGERILANRRRRDEQARPRGSDGGPARRP